MEQTSCFSYVIRPFTDFMKKVRIMSFEKVAILQSNYIPWKGYFDIIRKVDAFVIYDTVQYTRQDWRNRNCIKTPQGLMWLTVPVNSSLTDAICEVKIAPKGWKEKHWNSIANNYAKAACFKTHGEMVKEWILGKDFEFLSEMNTHLIQQVNQFLGIQTKIIQSTELELLDDRCEKLAHICSQLGAKTYLSGPAAKDYLDESHFQKRNIRVEWMDYSGYPEYPQRFPPFTHGVSIIDLILNTGDEAIDYLNKRN